MHQQNVKTYSLQIDEESLLNQKNELGFTLLVRIKTKNIQEETMIDELMQNMQIEGSRDLK